MLICVDILPWYMVINVDMCWFSVLRLGEIQRNIPRVGQTHRIPLDVPWKIKPIQNGGSNKATLGACPMHFQWLSHQNPGPKTAGACVFLHPTLHTDIQWPGIYMNLPVFLISWKGSQAISEILRQKNQPDTIDSRSAISFPPRHFFMKPRSRNILQQMISQLHHFSTSSPGWFLNGPATPGPSAHLVGSKWIGSSTFDAKVEITIMVHLGAFRCPWPHGWCGDCLLTSLTTPFPKESPVAWGIDVEKQTNKMWIGVN